MAPLVAMGGGRLSFAGALPRLVSTAAARMDRSSAVLASGAGPNGRVDFRIDPDCRNVFTCTGLAVAHCSRLCLWVLGISANLRQYRFCQRARLPRCPLSAARQNPTAPQPPSEVNFYEWKKTAAGKQPYAIALADRSLMALAGLWENWRSSAGEWMRSFAIVTTAPNELCAELHNRMLITKTPTHGTAFH